MARIAGRPARKGAARGRAHVDPEREPVRAVHHAGQHGQREDDAEPPYRPPGSAVPGADHGDVGDAERHRDRQPAGDPGRRMVLAEQAGDRLDEVDEPDRGEEPPHRAARAWRQLAPDPAVGNARPPGIAPAGSPVARGCPVAAGHPRARCAVARARHQVLTSPSCLVSMLPRRPAPITSVPILVFTCSIRRVPGGSALSPGSVMTYVMGNRSPGNEARQKNAPADGPGPGLLGAGHRRRSADTAIHTGTNRPAVRAGLHGRG